MLQEFFKNFKYVKMINTDSGINFCFCDKPIVTISKNKLVSVNDENIEIFVKYFSKLLFEGMLQEYSDVNNFDYFANEITTNTIIKYLNKRSVTACFVRDNFVKDNAFATFFEDQSNTVLEHLKMLVTSDDFLQDDGRELFLYGYGDYFMPEKAGNRLMGASANLYSEFFAFLSKIKELISLYQSSDEMYYENKIDANRLSPEFVYGHIKNNIGAKVKRNEEGIKDIFNDNLNEYAKQLVDSSTCYYNVKVTISLEEIYSFMPNTLLKVLSYSISSFPDYESAYQGSKLYKTFVDAFIDICYDLETDEIKETLYNKLLEREEVIKK